MRILILLCLCSLALFVAKPAAAQHGGYGNATIRCESVGYRRQFCPAETRRGVRLVRQTSNSECVRGRTWWRDDRGIVVTEGCGGDFELGYRDEDYQSPPSYGGGGYNRPDTLRCESRDFRRRYCPADISYGAASLVRQLSDTRCVYGRNWAYDRRGIWVDDGCAGEFEIGYADNAWRPGAGGGSWVRCESRDYGQEVCGAPRNRGVVLVRQISRSACIEGRTWGYDRNRIWVNGGCAADFEVR